MAAEGIFAVFGPWAVALALVLTRISALVLTTPVFSAGTIPAHVKMGLVGTLALVVMFKTGPVPALADLNVVRIMGAVITEAVAGAVMGLAVTVLFGALQFAGQLAGIQMGLAVANLIDPVSYQSVGLIAQVMASLGLLLFLIFDGHLMMVRALLDSFRVLPLGALSPDAPALLAECLRLGSRMFELGLRLALPVVGVVLFVNVGLGIIARTVPQVNVFIIGFLLTIGGGLLILALSLPGIAQVVRALVDEAVRTALRLNRLM